MKNNIVNNLKNFKFLKKYNYDVNQVIGVKNKQQYILYSDRKLIRIYRNELKSSSLLSTYIPIEQAIFYSFEIEKSVLEKIDLDKFIETKIYEEAGVEETESYVIKYKVIDSLKDDKIVNIETIIVPENYLINSYKNILDKTDYIDYISFPAFAYKALYDQKILRKANDLFIVILYDKMFLTFYHEGDLLSIVTLSGGLDKIYEYIRKLNIKNLDIDIFKKLLQKKGVNKLKYTNKEKKVLETLNESVSAIANVINSQIDKIKIKFNIDEIERIYITSEYGNIDGLEEYVQKILEIDTFNFEFYEDYNLDRLSVDPFLFLGMLETHVAYKQNNQNYNFSLFLRKPTFFYRPSGRLFLILFFTFTIASIYPLYLYFNGVYLNKEVINLQFKIKNYIIKNTILQKNINIIKKQKKQLQNEKANYLKSINKSKNFIKSIYLFKYNYIPKSDELTRITILMNSNHVYLNSLTFNKGIFVLDVFSFNDTNIPNFLDSLIKKGFNVTTKGIEYKNSQYKSIIRIEE